MLQYEFNLLIPLEQNIQSYLTAVRKANPEEYRVTMFTLFTNLNAARVVAISRWRNRHTGRADWPQDTGIAVATFNKTIGDLKKVGIIGTCKGGEEAFLSNAAWELHVATSASKAVVRG